MDPNNQGQEILCKNGGCLKKFKESENHAEACSYHPGKPIFHDLKKGWTCCNKIVYDWEEFERLKGCATGHHASKKQTPEDGEEFYKSKTVNRAQMGIENFEDTPKNIKSIDDYNKKEEEKAKVKAEEEKNKEKKYFYTKNGKLRCVNKGCGKEFTLEENCENICKYHVGEPVFHDLKKYWTCCKKETWDWDEFINLPTCAEGHHVPKMV